MTWSLSITDPHRQNILDLSYFEIDMAFKRIQGEIKEWELVVYVENFQKNM
ncbi:hypothetical protein RhiirC2_800143 [Rhizophagus irregularis]|uniref:Uncharacterized protein n=1 Tax=Rhizophagus irregularis TaxID=588596 RepID=A0A2N1M430_9GLOM|nr:hypothetical protein RhiirC2_800143 [Rhizophagus irregularis]